MSTSHEAGNEPDTPPPNYNNLSHPLEQPAGYPKPQSSQQQPTAGVSQPYVAQTYVLPQVMTAQQMQPSSVANIGQPSTFQMPMVRQSESESRRKLNLAAAILSGILFGLTILGLLIGPVAHDHGYLIFEITMVGSIGGLLFMVGMIMSCIAACKKDVNKRGKDTNKRGVLITAIVMYSLSVGLLVTWPVLYIHQEPWMLLFLVVGFGSLALAIISGISCSQYSDNNPNIIVMYGGAPQHAVVGDNPQISGNSVQMVYLNPALGQQQVTYLTTAQQDQQQDACQNQVVYQPQVGKQAPLACV